jgi:hypothetical protein
MKAKDYVAAKIAHMKRNGINASIGEHGGAQPDWAKSEADERQKRGVSLKQKAKRKEEFYDDGL